MNCNMFLNFPQDLNHLFTKLELNYCNICTIIDILNTFSILFILHLTSD